MRPAASGAITGTIAALLIGTLVQASPRPAPAPGATPKAWTTTQLAQQVTVLDREVTRLRARLDCFHHTHVRMSTRPNAAVPVTWKTSCLEARR